MGEGAKVALTVFEDKMYGGAAHAVAATTA